MARKPKLTPQKQAALRRGAKIKLTPQRQKALLEALSVGATQRIACDYAGISQECLYGWLRRGKKGESPFSEFSEAYTRTQGQAAITWLQVIESAAHQGDWNAARWKLERRWPDEWGPKERVDVRITLVEQAAKKVAAELGMTAAEVLAEAQALLREVDHASNA